jgi:hypothetical protein
MPNLLAVEMDCNPDTSDESIRTTAGKYNVTATLMDPNGPGGGCPVYSFVGTEADLRTYLTAEHNPGLDGTDLEEEINFYLSTATAL